jgi:hypothetical protein
MHELIKSIKSTILRVLRLTVPKTADKLRYLVAYRSICNLKNPTSFSEKLLWLRWNTYYQNRTVLDCCDKYLVREYVTEKGCGDTLNELIEVWGDYSDIEWDVLPDSFVLKRSQGCNDSFICANKSEYDKNELKKYKSMWGKEELTYDIHMAKTAGIKPSELTKWYICESYLSDNNEHSLTDYKFYCFNGEPKAILVISGRYQTITGAFMSLDWEQMSTLTGKYSMLDKPLRRPESLEKMIDVARKLSEPFPFVRVDLYDVNGKVVFGELTFYPNGCINMQETDIDGVSMADLLDLEIQGA